MLTRRDVQYIGDGVILDNYQRGSIQAKEEFLNGRISSTEIVEKFAIRQVLHFDVWVYV